MNSDYNLDIDDNIKMVQNNNIYYKIGLYIINKFDKNMDVLEAKKFGKSLVTEVGFTLESILDGKADDLIYFELNSKIKKNEEVKSLPLKTLKTQTPKKLVTGMIASLIAVTSIYSFALKPIYNEMKENAEIQKNIAKMSSEIGSDDHKYQRSIVAQNTYRIGDNAYGENIIAYHNDNIAKDIITVCTKDPGLFDICMYEVYFDMNYNILNNMDDVVRYLKMYTANDESLSFIKDKLSNCDIFLDYVIARGFANPNDKEYYKVLEDIELYKKVSGDVPYNSISKESQKRIDNLINEFKKNNKNLYSNYKEERNVDEINYGTRS